jgi:peptidoglycan/xylan/chitin deacetylase (PgdA/CDA1 family)
MKAITKGFVVLLSLAVFAGNSFAAHRITTWPDNRKGSVSLGFDDGCASHLTLGVPGLNARGLKGTFFLITRNGETLVDWNAWRNAVAQGHEVGSHTMSHPHLTQIPIADAQQEMSGAKADIESQIPSQKGVSFVYPYGELNSTVKSYAQSIYIGSKGIRCGLNGETVDFGELKGCSPDDQEDDGRGGGLIGMADAAETEGKWLDAFIHSLNAGADGCYGVWGNAQWTSFLDHLLTKDLYVGTFGSLVKYSKERVNATLAEVSSSSSQIVLSLTDTLDDAIYNRPLTVRSELPAGWLSVNVRQGSGAVTAIDSILEGTTRVIYYNAVPDGGNITITGTNLQSAPQISALAPQTVTVGSPGFTLQVIGSGFVSGATVRWNGADRSTTFGSSTQLQASIPAADIATAGTVSVTVRNPDAVVSNSLNLTMLAPASPQISALAPQTVTVGSPGFTLQVTGSGFVSGAAVRWNGTDRSTTFVSATQLQADIPGSDLVTPGTVFVTVRNPDAVISNVMNFTVLAPALSLTGITIIDGLSVLCGGDNSAYTATASWSDNTTSVVNPTWSVDPTTHASIDASSGLLRTVPGGGVQMVTVQASFTFNGVTRTASKTVEISDCTPPPPPPQTSPGAGGGGCSAVGPYGPAGLLDIAGSFGALILLMAWLKGRERRENERGPEGQG